MLVIDDQPEPRPKRSFRTQPMGAYQMDVPDDLTQPLGWKLKRPDFLPDLRAPPTAPAGMNRSRASSLVTANAARPASMPGTIRTVGETFAPPDRPIPQHSPREQRRRKQAMKLPLTSDGEMRSVRTSITRGAVPHKIHPQTCHSARTAAEAARAAVSRTAAVDEGTAEELELKIEPILIKAAGRFSQRHCSWASRASRLLKQIDARPADLYASAFELAHRETCLSRLAVDRPLAPPPTHARRNAREPPPATAWSLGDSIWAPRGPMLQALSAVWTGQSKVVEGSRSQSKSAAQPEGGQAVATRAAPSRAAAAAASNAGGASVWTARAHATASADYYETEACLRALLLADWAVAQRSNGLYKLVLQSAGEEVPGRGQLDTALGRPKATNRHARKQYHAATSAEHAPSPLDRHIGGEGGEIARTAAALGTVADLIYGAFDWFVTPPKPEACPGCCRLIAARTSATSEDGPA